MGFLGGLFGGKPKSLEERAKDKGITYVDHGNEVGQLIGPVKATGDTKVKAEDNLLAELKRVGATRYSGVSYVSRRKPSLTYTEDRVHAVSAIGYKASAAGYVKK